MPKPRKNERIRCAYFNWRLFCRAGLWYADGRSNSSNAGRHSLGTSNQDEALRFLPQLDQLPAEQIGLAPRSERSGPSAKSISLGEGRKLYEAHISRPRVAGGVRASTFRRYKSIFDKFLQFAASRNVTTWNGVSADLLTAYAADLDNKGYAYKTLDHELTTLKQAVKWMIQKGLLLGIQPIVLPLRKAESEPAYCYRLAEVRAMRDYCRADPNLHWIGEIIVALACTGLRISELVALRWSDLDLKNKMLCLTDETGHAVENGRKRRELKSGRSRSFPIHADLMKILRQMPQDTNYVFRSPHGKQLNSSLVRNLFTKLVIEPLASRFPSPNDGKGFKDGRLHSFRHYFCSMSANN